MVLQGLQVQFHSAKQIANSWIPHSAAAAACAMQKTPRTRKTGGSKDFQTWTSFC